MSEVVFKQRQTAECRGISEVVQLKEKLEKLRQAKLAGQPDVVSMAREIYLAHPYARMILSPVEIGSIALLMQVTPTYLITNPELLYVTNNNPVAYRMVQFISFIMGLRPIVTSTDPFIGAMELTTHVERDGIKEKIHGFFSRVIRRPERRSSISMPKRYASSKAASPAQPILPDGTVGTSVLQRSTESPRDPNPRSVDATDARPIEARPIEARPIEGSTITPYPITPYPIEVSDGLKSDTPIHTRPIGPITDHLYPDLADISLGYQPIVISPPEPLSTSSVHPSEATDIEEKSVATRMEHMVTETHMGDAHIHEGGRTIFEDASHPAIRSTHVLMSPFIGEQPYEASAPPSTPDIEAQSLEPSAPPVGSAALLSDRERRGFDMFEDVAMGSDELLVESFENFLWSDADIFDLSKYFGVDIRVFYNYMSIDGESLLMLAVRMSCVKQADLLLRVCPMLIGKFDPWNKSILQYVTAIEKPEKILRMLSSRLSTEPFRCGSTIEGNARAMYTLFVHDIYFNAGRGLSALRKEGMTNFTPFQTSRKEMHYGLAALWGIEPIDLIKRIHEYATTHINALLIDT